MCQSTHVKNYFSSDFKLGILGGGQLGRMLLAETQKFDIYTCVLDASKEAPCATYCNAFYQGDLLDFETVYNFGKKVDLLTIEIENVNTDALEKLENEGLKVFPSSKTLRKIQNKAIQKQLYKDNNIPTAAFTDFTDLNALKAAIDTEKIKFPFVWKRAQFGYDGTGVKIVKSRSDLANLPNTQCIAEDLVNFKTELAVIVARNAKGNVTTYPVVEMDFHKEANQVEYIICPARISSSEAKKATEIALKVSKIINHVGILAVELFLTSTGHFLVNEVAPRAHNSGHFSIENSFTNQFEQHLRSILNLPLGSTKNKTTAVMVNLVGAENYSGNVVYKNLDKILKIEGVTPHIYGKKKTRAFRKMGHVTIVHHELSKALSIAKKVKKTIQVISK